MQTNMPDEYREKIKRILDDERWKGYVSGKVQGALTVMDIIDLNDKEERIRILSDAVGLSNATATGFVENWDEDESSSFVKN